MRIIRLGLFGVALPVVAVAFGYSIVTGENWMLGFIILAYFIAQLSFSVLNARADCRRKDDAVDLRTAAIMLVGYREKPEFWDACIRSIRLHAADLGVVCACVDGNDGAADWGMRTAFRDVFVHTDPVECPGGLVEISLSDNSIVMSLPHRGKRETMRSGFEYIRRHHPTIEDIIVMDSDTVITPGSVHTLLRCVRSDPRNGCATGLLRIFDEQRDLISRTINARYAYAFRIERGAMSYMGCMNCCSGPFSVYRTACLDDDLLDQFITQKCGGSWVGPGDDRHLTNLIMMRGHKSRQSPGAVAYTECPQTIHRFLIQQLRWMRSFYREQPYQIMAIGRQSWYLCVVTIYEILLPFVVILAFLPNLSFVHRSSDHVFYRRLVVCAAVVLIRTCLLLIMERRLDMLFNIFMLPAYFILLLPLKIYGLLTMGAQGWLTSDRFLITWAINPDVVLMYGVIVGWNVMYVLMIYYRFFFT